MPTLWKTTSVASWPAPTSRTTTTTATPPPTARVIPSPLLAVTERPPTPDQPSHRYLYFYFCFYSNLNFYFKNIWANGRCQIIYIYCPPEPLLIKTREKPKTSVKERKNAKKIKLTQGAPNSKLVKKLYLRGVKNAVVIKTSYDLLRKKEKGKKNSI